MGDITKHFSRWEFECKGEGCCDNSAPMDRDFINSLEAARVMLGSTFKINSGFRCKKHNASTPGAAENSMHTLGLAADIDAGPTGYSAKELAKRLQAMGVFHGVIAYPDRNFVHVDHRLKSGIHKRRLYRVEEG